MARELKPCGTFAAYARHKKNGEAPCEPCMQAMRDQKNGRVADRRRSAGEARLAAVPDPPSVVESPDRLAVARDSLAIVEATLRSPDTPGGSISGLTRRREELVDLILELTTSEGQVSLRDELAAVREARKARA